MKTGAILNKGGETMYFPINRRKMGKICQENRKRDGWTQAEIALDIGCDIRCISQFESGYTTSWRVLSWYMLNGYLDKDIVRGCARYA